MPLSQFYYILGMMMVIIPLAATFGFIVLEVFSHLRYQRPLRSRPLLLLCMVALIPALAGIAVLSFAGS